jgi:hypothetical protein
MGTPGVGYWWWHVCCVKQGMNGNNNGFGVGTECIGDDDLAPTAGTTIVQATFRHHLAKHFLQTQGLCTELYFIGPTGASYPDLMLYRMGNAVYVKLYHISPPGQPQPFVPDWQGILHPNPFPQDAGGCINPGVGTPPAQRKDILLPHMLYMNEGTLPGAIRIVLQGRYRDMGIR